jgi:hypothetical protein
MEVVRLGDIIDDHCTRCHMIMDHSVVAMVGEEVKRVRCRTCNYEHDYRHGKGGKSKKPKKLSAYEEVLASITAGRPGSSTEPENGKASRPPARGRTRTLSLRSRSLPKR